MSTIPPIDFNNTGASEGANLKYINIVLHKTGEKQDQCEMRFGKSGKHFSEFVGQLIGIKAPKFKTAEGDLPARHEYGFVLKSKDTEDGQIKNFLLQLSSHWKSPIVSDIVNPLSWVWGNPDHNKLVRIRVYSIKPAGGRAIMRAIVSDANQADANQFMTCQFPWEGTKKEGKFKGVPEPATGTDGKKDWSTIANFWHEVILKMAGATQPQAPAQPAATTPPPPVTPAAAPAPTPQLDPKTMSMSQRALSWIKNKYGKLLHGDKNAQAFLNIVKEGFALATSQGATQQDFNEMSTACVTLAAEEFVPLPPGHVFNNAGEIVQGPPPYWADIPF